LVALNTREAILESSERFSHVEVVELAGCEV
jgi:hypothetical protein